MHIYEYLSFVLSFQSYDASIVFDYFVHFWFLYTP